MEQIYRPAFFLHNNIINNLDLGLQKAISRLFATLQIYKVAFALCSKTGIEDMASEPSTLFRLVQNSNFNYEHYRKLLRFIVKEAFNVDIWNAVFNLIITVSQITPPTTVPIFFDNTSIKSSSKS